MKSFTFTLFASIFIPNAFAAEPVYKFHQYIGLKPTVAQSPAENVTPVISFLDDSTEITNADLGTVYSLSTVNKILRIKNKGNTSMYITAWTVGAGYSKLVDGCTNQTLAPASECSITIEADTQSNGVKYAAISVVSPDLAQTALLPVTINVQPTGLIAKVSSVVKTKYTFADTYIGENKTVSISITNDTAAPFTFSASKFSVAAPFSYVSGCSATLAAGATCTASFKFKPTVDSLAKGMILVNRADNVQLPLLQLEGSGVKPFAYGTASVTQMTFTSTAQAAIANKTPLELIERNGYYYLLASNAYILRATNKAGPYTLISGGSSNTSISDIDFVNGKLVGIWPSVSGHSYGFTTVENPETTTNILNNAVYVDGQNGELSSNGSIAVTAGSWGLYYIMGNSFNAANSPSSFVKSVYNSGGQWLAGVNSANPNKFYVSSDGVNWTQRSYNFPTSSSGYAVTAAITKIRNNWVMSMSSGIVKSSDLTTWVNSSHGATIYSVPGAIAGTTKGGVAQMRLTSSELSDSLYSSTDGSYWVKIPDPFVASNIAAVQTLNDKVIVLGKDFTLAELPSN